MSGSIFRGSLATRVAWATALMVPAAGAVVVLVSWLIAGSMAAEAEDIRLRDAAGVFARELEADGVDPIAIAVDETDELVHTGIRVAVQEDGAHLTGDAALGLVEAGTCRDRGSLRVCGVRAGAWVAVAGRARSLGREPAELVLPAGLISVLLTSLLGGAIAYGLGRRLAAPVSRLHAAVAAVPLDDPASAPLGSDEGVAEIDALRGTLTRAFHDLGAALARERGFVRDAAHELRTPLTLVLGELDLVAEQLQPADRAGVLRARRVAARLAVLVERLLLLARPEQALADEEIDLAELLEDACDNVSPAARERVRIASTNVIVRGDRALLAAMLGNAVENALKFSSDEVRIEVAERGERVAIVVRDEGPGISREDQERVFLPFFRTRQARSGAAAGHGIGLALVAHAAALHGGSARFADAPRGACLEMEISRGARRLERVTGR